MREPGSSSQYQPIQRQWAQHWRACLYVPLLCKWIGLLQHVKSRFFFGYSGFVRPPSLSESSRAVGNLPLTLSPVLPTLSAGKRAGENRIRDTDEAPLRCSRPRCRDAGVAEAHRRVTIIIHREEKIPEYLQTHLRMRCIGDLKGQIRWFLTLSARSLPVFAEPNASPSATSVCPLLYPPPLPSPPLPTSLLLPPSLPPSDPVTAPLTQGLPNKHSHSHGYIQ